MRDQFAQVPLWLARDATISMTARALYAVMATYTNRRRICWPSHASLADNLGCSISTVQRALLELERAGAIVIQSGRSKHRPNTYAMPMERSTEASYIAAVDAFLSRQQRPSRSR
jgi:DNA-binding transcriptional regulator YhcF (GntR family)